MSSRARRHRRACVGAPQMPTPRHRTHVSAAERVRVHLAVPRRPRLDLARVALTAQPLRLAPRKSARPATSGRRVLPSTLIDGRALAHHSRLLERGHLDVELLAPGGLHLLATRRRRRQLNDRSIVLLLLMLGQLELANEAVVGHLWQQPTRHTRPSVASVGTIRRSRRHSASGSSVATRGASSVALVLTFGSSQPM